MLTRRHMEVGTGLALALLGAVVLYGSTENGIGWTDVGPAAGYFPFRIGLLIVVLGVAIAIRYALAGRMRRPADVAAADPSHPTEGFAAFDSRFLEDGALGRIASVFLPTAVAAALIPWLGLYLASVLFLIFSMMTLGKLPLWKAGLISVGTMVAFYAIFEIWFQVPLEKGVVLPLLGIN
ncbi:tripartite tricarboxylate transporter TctB family protein [Mangrovicella endophytica]|uniref:tripartite tricarboxylate transporter TctB family protein n=1 Tax=Mangrovicella endophytica TaxID=2066697 RepID=UPI0012FFE29D|nr:tripartite tricarboxylate transporter TctB family protein [Mangrovicella endophytica]